MNKSTFSFQNLLTKTSDGVTGPMGPVSAINRLTEAKIVPKYTGLVRVWFEDPEIHQRYEGPGKSELTGHDTLMTVGYYKDTTMYCMAIDMGSTIAPVAICFFEDPDEIEVTVTPVYEDLSFQKKLSTEDIAGIFAEAENHNFEPIKKEESNA